MTSIEDSSRFQLESFPDPVTPEHGADTDTTTLNKKLAFNAEAFTAAVAANGGNVALPEVLAGITPLESDPKLAISNPDELIPAAMAADMALVTIEQLEAAYAITKDIFEDVARQAKTAADELRQKISELTRSKSDKATTPRKAFKSSWRSRFTKSLILLPIVLGACNKAEPTKTPDISGGNTEPVPQLTVDAPAPTEISADPTTEGNNLVLPTPPEVYSPTFTAPKPWETPSMTATWTLESPTDTPTSTITPETPVDASLPSETVAPSDTATSEPLPTSTITNTVAAESSQDQIVFSPEMISARLEKVFGTGWSITQNAENQIITAVSPDNSSVIELQNVNSENFNLGIIEGKITISGTKTIEGSILIQEGIPVTLIQERDMTPGKEFVPTEIVAFVNGAWTTVDTLPVWSIPSYTTDEKGTRLISDQNGEKLWSYSYGRWFNEKPVFYEMGKKLISDGGGYKAEGYINIENSATLFAAYGALIGFEPSMENPGIYELYVKEVDLTDNVEHVIKLNFGFPYNGNVYFGVNNHGLISTQGADFVLKEILTGVKSKQIGFKIYSEYLLQGDGFSPKVNGNTQQITLFCNKWLDENIVDPSIVHGLDLFISSMFAEVENSSLDAYQIQVK